MFLFYNITKLDLKAILQLKALPHLVPPKGKLKIKEAGRFKHWKPSTAEAVESLIIHTKVILYFLRVATNQGNQGN